MDIKSEAGEDGNRSFKGIMNIEMIGTESLGVRGLSCVVRTADRCIVIDPGIALGYRRKGLLPHPHQVAAGEDIRRVIIRALGTATDIVISHFHGDHMPLQEANPYQLAVDDVKDLVQSPRLWIKGKNGESPHIADRRDRLLSGLERTADPCEGVVDGSVAFSECMPHGSGDNPSGTVMMTRIEENAEVFVHASDIQLLDDEPVHAILAWKPTIIFVSGPPVYRDLSTDTLIRARERIKEMASEVRFCVVDHHLLRSIEGVEWLDTLRKETEGTVLCAADFMNRSRNFLEARRKELYTRFPVPEDWHERYSKGMVDTDDFRM